MSRNLLPFLYQTRTLRYACRRPATILFIQKAGVSTRPKQATPRRADNSIPFEWDGEEDAAAHAGSEEQGTLTPSETEIFKSIFDDISQGQLPKSRKRTQPAEEQADGKTQESAQSSGDQRQGNTLVEQARDSESSVEFLQRYPASLQRAAKAALGKFNLAPPRPKLRDMAELDKVEAKQKALAANYEKRREKKKLQVEERMKACKTDAQLWKVMEKDVFSLPEGLGIFEDGIKDPRAASETVAEDFKEQKRIKEAKKKEDKKQQRLERNRKKREKAEKKKREKEKELGIEEEEEIEEHEEEEAILETDPAEPRKKKRLIMDIHGPLYPHFLLTGLELFDTAFPKPSLLALSILPRIKENGLPSYVLGVSTPFFVKLAEIHWRRFGDCRAALDTLDEMKKMGLHLNEDVGALVDEMASHIHSCTWGAQGPFVMAMMEVPPYQGTLTRRLERLKAAVEHSTQQPDGQPWVETNVRL
ncbi:hypothetical protein NM208_g13270 [Fusarium decemcellulare]|uniref:Uncharacterized protein n=1 Tax=Fusarium decemcellulare TaxID=57161 RepID=A0ACC1RMD3_9HYPO|nr:hypothetical protein NM208_g13270 [Fusarium decemcellulare]